MYSTSYHENFKKFLIYVQDNDLVVDGAMTDPKGDRSKAPHLQDDPDMFVHIKERRPDGIVVRGAKCHQTGSINSHWHIVMPTQSMKEEDKEFAVSFACPNEYIFMAGEYDFAGMMVERFAGFHRQSYGGCKVGVGDVVIGAAALAAEYNGAAKASAVKDKLIEMTHLNETLYSCGIACSTEDRMRVLRFLENICLGSAAVGYRTESMHGAGSPQAQRIMIQRQGDIEGKKQLVKNIAGILEKNK